MGRQAPRASVALLACAALAALATAAGSAAPPEREAPVVTHGAVVGDVTATSAVMWARADRESVLNVVLSGGGHRRVAPTSASAAHDFTARAVLEGLAPDTTYRYRAWFSRAPGRGVQHGPAISGSFSTAPGDLLAVPVRLAFGGDISGQNVCRDAVEGFPITETIRWWGPDVFVGLGDMIYADNACTASGRYGNAQEPGASGPAVDLPGFWASWRYNRADAGLQRLLASASYVGIWDDHEVVNDFGPLSDAPATPPYTGAHLLPLGRQAFVDYTPLSPGARLYRSLRWGRHLELFVLDTRWYRDANAAPDDPARPKSMLGREQLVWLKESLAASDATWKVIVSSVPMSIPTGFPPTNGRDGWANFDQTTGFEHELLDILRFLQAREIDRPVWITTDVHFAEAFRYRPFADDPGFVVHELATGPLNAGIFPNRSFDDTLDPEVLAFFGPETPEAVTSWDEAKRWFNFGTLEIEQDGTLTLGIVNTHGERQFSLALAPR